MNIFKPVIITYLLNEEVIDIQIANGVSYRISHRLATHLKLLKEISTNQLKEHRLFHCLYPFWLLFHTR